MMNYETFKGIVENEFLGSMGPEFEGMKLEVIPVKKVNVTLDGMCVRDPSKPDQLAPTIYINDMYEHYKQTGDLMRVISKTAETVKSYGERAEELREIVMSDSMKENVKDKVFFQLINKDQNKDLLSDCPYRTFEDLAIIYRILISKDKDGIASSVIHNNLAEKYGMSEADLFEAAVINTKQLLPTVVRPMEDVMRDIFASDGMPEDMIDLMLPDVPSDMQLYVISNSQGVDGAVNMLYEEELYKLSQEVHDNLVILPSSIHEVLALPIGDNNVEELADLVKDVNMSMVPVNERLSNQVYMYDCQKRTLKQVTDTPNKNLVNEVAEQNLIYNLKQSR